MTCVLPAWSKFLSVFFEHLWSAFTCLSRICLRLLFTKHCDCSVNTELIRRMDSYEKKIDVVKLSTEVDSVSTTSHFQCSATQQTYPSDLEFLHNWWSTEYPIATIDCISLIPLAFFSGTQESPVSVYESWRIHFENARVLFLSKSMSLNMDMKIIRSLKLWGLMRCPSKSFWIFWRSSEAVLPAKTFHSNAIGSPL